MRYVGSYPLQLRQTETGKHQLRPSHRIGLPMKAAFLCCTLFHASVNLPFYGPGNYLWFCDLALLLATVGICLESRLLISMCALSSLGPGTLWTVDLLGRVLTHHWFIGMAAYIGAKSVPPLVRIAATFHIWLPIVLCYCLTKMRYDRRALFYQTILAIALLITCRLTTRPPPGNGPADNVNVNFVYGHSDVAPQTALPPWLYLTRMIVMYWVLMYLPLHLLLSHFFGRFRHLGQINLGQHVADEVCTRSHDPGH